MALSPERYIDKMLHHFGGATSCAVSGYDDCSPPPYPPNLILKANRQDDKTEAWCNIVSFARGVPKALRRHPNIKLGEGGKSFPQNSR